LGEYVNCFPTIIIIKCNDFRWYQNCSTRLISFISSNLIKDNVGNLLSTFNGGQVTGTILFSSHALSTAICSPI